MHFGFLGDSQTRIHDQEHWKRRQCQQGGLLQQKPNQNQYESDILGVTNLRIGAGDCQGAGALRGVQHIPRTRQQIEAAGQEDLAGDVKRTEMRIAFLA